MAEESAAMSDDGRRCPDGHLYAGENLYVAPDGTWRCRACHRFHNRKWRQRRRLEARA